jgi:hypothetical protein
MIPQLQQQPQRFTTNTGITEQQQQLNKFCRFTQRKTERDFELVESIAHPLLKELRGYHRRYTQANVSSDNSHSGGGSSSNPMDNEELQQTSCSSSSCCQNAIMPIRRQSFDVTENDDNRTLNNDDIWCDCQHGDNDNCRRNAVLPQRKNSIVSQDDGDDLNANKHHPQPKETSAVTMTNVDASTYSATIATPATPLTLPHRSMSQENVLFRAKLLGHALDDMGLFDEDMYDDDEDDSKSEDDTRIGILRSISAPETKTKHRFSRFPPSA